MGPYGQAQDKKKGDPCFERAVVVASHGTSSRTILFCSKRVSFEKNTLASSQKSYSPYITFLTFFEFDARMCRLALFLIQKEEELEKTL